MPLLICLFNSRFHLTTGQNKTHTLGGWCDTGHYQLGRLNLSWDRRELNYFSSEILSFVVATYLIRVKVLRSVPFTPLLCISFPWCNLFFFSFSVTFTFLVVAFPFILEEPAENIGMGGKMRRENLSGGDGCSRSSLVGNEHWAGKGLKYTAICFLTHRPRLRGWCSVQRSHWEWLSEVGACKGGRRKQRWGGAACRAGIRSLFSSLSAPSLWSHTLRSVCTCVWGRLMTHPNWESLSSPAVPACLKWWTQDGINSQTPWILLPLCLTSFCLPHLCVYIVMFVCVWSKSRSLFLCVCVFSWESEGERLSEMEFTEQHYSIESFLLCFPVLESHTHTLWNDYMSAILTIWVLLKLLWTHRTSLGNYASSSSGLTCQRSAQGLPADWLSCDKSILTSSKLIWPGR